MKHAHVKDNNPAVHTIIRLQMISFYMSSALGSINIWLMRHKVIKLLKKLNNLSLKLNKIGCQVSYQKHKRNFIRTFIITILINLTGASGCIVIHPYDKSWIEQVHCYLGICVISTFLGFVLVLFYINILKIIRDYHKEANRKFEKTLATSDSNLKLNVFKIICFQHFSGYACNSAFCSLALKDARKFVKKTKVHWKL
ncbi:CLUMA_CG019315, isoform A [Clunio marinus]|uniref:CLUMA_CG019315, isoform A n=1 Tax=Clunio marinus TaxID=568069 RepID=A0A1J1J0V6_9DIPT|nr:CLUMA_CG019315, isoform A [Clunio marinus]